MNLPLVFACTRLPHARSALLAARLCSTSRQPGRARRTAHHRRAGIVRGQGVRLAHSHWHPRQARGANTRLGAGQGDGCEGAGDHQAPGCREAQARETRLRCRRAQDGCHRRDEHCTGAVGHEGDSRPARQPVLPGRQGRQEVGRDVGAAEAPRHRQRRHVHVQLRAGHFRRTRRHHHPGRLGPHTRNAAPGGARRGRGGTGHPAEHGPVPVPDRHRPGGRGPDRRHGQRPRAEGGDGRGVGRGQGEGRDRRPERCARGTRRRSFAM